MDTHIIRGSGATIGQIEKSFKDLTKEGKQTINLNKWSPADILMIKMRSKMFE